MNSMNVRAALPNNDSALRSRADSSVARPQVSNDVRPQESRHHAEPCPLTLETAEELQRDAYYSAVDDGRLYSAPALRQWLGQSAVQRAEQGASPLFVSPVTSRNMQADATALRLELPARISLPDALCGISAIGMLGFALTGVAFLATREQRAWQIPARPVVSAIQMQQADMLDARYAFLWRLLINEAGILAGMGWALSAWGFDS